MKKENISAKGGGEYKFTSTAADGETETTHLSMQQLIEILHFEISIHAEYIDPNLKNVIPLDKWELELESSEFIASVRKLGVSTTESVIEFYKTHSSSVSKYIQSAFDPAITDEMAKWLSLRDALRDEVQRRRRGKEAGQEKPQLKSLATVDGFLRGPADPINQHMFGAFTPGAMKKHADAKGDVNNLEARGMTGVRDYSAVYIVESNKDLYGVIGYKQDVGEALWEFLQKHGALTLQAHIALFARAYAETDAAPGEFITLRILDFCDDLQFTRKKGYHDRETKQRVVSILECLTQAQMKIMYAPPTGKSHLLTGPIWQRGITHETASQPGGKLQWEPETFSYAPGQYFAFNEWRTYTRNVALIGEGLLKLNANKDKWAIHGGGYLALLSRMNGYRKQTLSVKTLLEKTGIFAAYAKFRKTSEMEQKLIRALETLETVGVIENWNWAKDEYDGETLAGKLASEMLFNRQIQIQYPVALKRNEKQITDGIAKHQKDNQKKIQSSIGN